MLAKALSMQLYNPILLFYIGRDRNHIETLNVF